MHVLENGSLYLRSLEPKHSGIYLCDASNGVNKSPVESSALVTVSSLPKVSIQNTLGNSGPSAATSSSSALGNKYLGFNLERLVLRKGTQTQLMCSVLGLDTPMTAEWLRPSGDLVADESPNRKSYVTDSSRIVLREESKLNEKRAYLYISHVERPDNGVYACLGTNSHGYSLGLIELRVQEPPERPVHFRAVEVASRSVTLSWVVEFGGNSPITSYVVEYRAVGTDLDNDSSGRSTPEVRWPTQT